MLLTRNYNRFKIAGQLLFWLFSILFAISAFYVASEHKLSFNSDILLRAIIPNVGFALAVYLNLYILIPKYLRNKNYIFFAFGLILVLSVSSVLIYSIFITFLNADYFSEQFASMFSSYFFTAAFYVGITSLFKFVKDWVQLQEMNLKFSRIEREKLEAELNTLKSQLNPHFLFNCLNNIYSLALTNSPQTPEIILKLSDLMRHVLYESRENFIPVKKELDFMDNFIELQKIRLNNKIDVKYSVQGKVPEKTVIPLLFEPFIDNAFKHALNNPAPSPYIHLSVSFKGDKMLFQIENNYRFDAEQKTSKSSGIGLKNIERRLEFLYTPEEYHFELIKTDDAFNIKLEVQLK